MAECPLGVKRRVYISPLTGNLGMPDEMVDATVSRIYIVYGY